MDKKDKISDDYRKQVDEILDNQSDLSLFSPLNQKEQDEIWEDISTELDIGEVWNDISSDLDILMPVDSGSGIIVKCIAAILIILIGIIPEKKELLDPEISQPKILIENKQNDQPAEEIVKDRSIDSNIVKQVNGEISPSLSSPLNKSKEINTPASAERNGIGLVQATPIPLSNQTVLKVSATSETVDSNLVASQDKIPVEKPNIPPALLPDDLEEIKLFPETDYGRLKTNNNSSIAGSSLPFADRGRISGGLITLFKNTWLLNNETFNGLKSESFNTTELVFFPDIGLSLNYSLNKTWLLQADGFLYSNTGQGYYDYIHGHYSKKTVTLRYSTIALSVKHKFTGRGLYMPRSSINLLAGGYLSVLHYASEKINTDIENIGLRYNKIDFGMRLGGEFEFRIFDQLSIAPGLFVSFGIPNISKSNINIPDYSIKTHNGSAGFHLTFYYHFN